LIQIKAPNPIPTEAFYKFRIFTAGSIEGDTAERWQEKLVRLLENEDIVIMNPRRNDWDSTWKQEIENKQFREQVEWELDNTDLAHLVVFYFDKETKSPITLLELGLHANDDVVVCCPEGYWRKGNVDITCKRYGIRQVDTIEELAAEVKKKAKDWKRINQRMV
jgi:hypothetical protein